MIYVTETHRGNVQMTGTGLVCKEDNNGFVQSGLLVHLAKLQVFPDWWMQPNSFVFCVVSLLFLILMFCHCQNIVAVRFLNYPGCQN